MYTSDGKAWGAPDAGTYIADNFTAGADYPAWVELVARDFDNGLNKFDIRTDSLSYYTMECLEVVEGTEFELWTLVCDNIDFTTATETWTAALIYECNVDPVCTGPAPGSLATDETGNWIPLREVGNIVDAFTSVDAFEYVDYMYVLTGDVVYIDNSLY
jgi:hypothetical protein